MSIEETFKENAEIPNNDQDVPESINQAEMSCSNSRLSSYFTKEVVTQDPFDSVCELDSKKIDKQVPLESSQTKIGTNIELSESKTNINNENRSRQRDAWLPSESTRNILLNSNVNQDNSNILEIKPMLIGKDYNLPPNPAFSQDPYYFALIQHLSDESGINTMRRAPSIEQTNQNPDNLKELITNGWYGSALDLTHHILTNMGYQQEKGGAILTPLSAQVWLTRLALLIRTQNYQLAERELASFHNLDAPNVYFEYHSDLYPGRKGKHLLNLPSFWLKSRFRNLQTAICDFNKIIYKLSDIYPRQLIDLANSCKMASLTSLGVRNLFLSPISRLLHAELPFHLNRTKEALDRLYYLLAIIERIKSNLEKGFTEDGLNEEIDSTYKQNSLNIWTNREIRVLSSCLFIFLHELDYQVAIQIIHRIAKLCSNDFSLLSGLANILGRVYLQLGDLETAKFYFDKSIQTNHGEENKPQFCIQKAFQNALLCVGKCEFEEAKKHLQQVLRLDPTNVVAANNLAVCGLYLGDLVESVHALEKLTTIGLSAQLSDNSTTLKSTSLNPNLLYPSSLSTTSDLLNRPRRFCLHDVMVLNLVVLYEVESDLALSKKVELLKNLSKFCGEPVHLSAFKLPTKLNS